MKNNEELVIERRKFLKTSGAIAVGATFATLLPSNVVKQLSEGELFPCWFSQKFQPWPPI